MALTLPHTCKKPELYPTRMMFTVLINTVFGMSISENRIALDNKFSPAKNDYHLAVAWVHLLSGKGAWFLSNRVCVTQVFGKREGVGIEEGENGFIN